VATNLTREVAYDPKGAEPLLVMTRRPVGSPAERLRRNRWHRALRALSGIAFPVLLLLTWQLGVHNGWIDGRNFPAPSTTAQSSWELATKGHLWSDIWASTNRIVRGFLFGSAAGFVVGTVTGTSRWIRATLEPTLSAFYVVPKIALLPIFITLFGITDVPIIVLVSVSVFLFVWFSTMHTMATIPEGYLDAARSFNATRWERFRHVLLPAALPQLFVGLRVAINVSVLSAIAAEFIIGQNGLGYLIFTSRQLFINTWVYAGIACVAILGVALAAIVTQIGKLVTPWAALEHDRDRL
jgi:sulfonate transport system permease protein